MFIASEIRATVLSLGILFEKLLLTMFDIGSENCPAIPYIIGLCVNAAMVLKISISMEKSPLFPPEALQYLPDLEFVGLFADGKIFKGRLPLISPN